MAYLPSKPERDSSFSSSISSCTVSSVTVFSHSSTSAERMRISPDLNQASQVNSAFAFTGFGLRVSLNVLGNKCLLALEAGP